MKLNFFNSLYAFLVLCCMHIFEIHGSENDNIGNTDVSANYDDDVISICMATDDNYAQHAGVTIASILKNANPSDKLRIYILHKGLSKENIEKLQSLKSIKDFELIFRSVETDAVNHLKLNHKDLSLAAWFRLFIPELCFDCHKKSISEKENAK